MRAAVPAPRAFLMRRIEREFAAVAHRAQPVGVEAERDQIRARRDGAALAKSQIVLRRSALVAVTFDRDHPRRVFLQHCGIRLQRRAARVADVRAVVIEEHRLQRRVAVQIVERTCRHIVARQRLRRHWLAQRRRRIRRPRCLSPAAGERAACGRATGGWPLRHAAAPISRTRQMQSSDFSLIDVVVTMSIMGGFSCVSVRPVRDTCCSRSA